MADRYDDLKKSAAEKALEFISSQMIVGLGHGTTASFFIRALAMRLQKGLISEIFCIPCSGSAEKEASDLGLPLTTIESHPVIDCTVDGADEITINLEVLKGGGGALLKEKILAQASTREIIIADESKLSPVLGYNRSLPVEVLPFGCRSQFSYIESIGGKPVLRKNSKGEIFKTDQGNYILDCNFGPIESPADLAGKLEGRAGIVAHGLFLSLATDALVAGKEGVRHIRK
ncbi:MAG: ribose-5-phosphate isomerase RpiA [Syntrophales bacterium]|jgi:ribose 5-phosphate isomerase A|nr:ribose-5-phosphate isomerase RpiA [Syntrophales bacterium]MDY0043213.1 ribose-5-phosphate isomerase RpiA [Syntrophales bacterium]